MRAQAFAIAVLVLVLAGCGSGGGSSSRQTPSSAPPLTGSLPPGLAGKPAPAFTLKDARGGTLRSAALAGRPYLVTFLYTSCPDVCPLIGDEIRVALGKLGPAASRLAAVSVSVDPRGDTPAAVRRWLAAHHEPANFHYLIGSRRQLKPVWKSYFVGPQTPGDPHSVHTAVIWLVDARGRLKALVPAGQRIDTNALASELRALTRPSP